MNFKIKILKKPLSSVYEKNGVGEKLLKSTDLSRQFGPMESFLFDKGLETNFLNSNT